MRTACERLSSSCPPVLLCADITGGPDGLYYRFCGQVGGWMAGWLGGWVTRSFTPSQAGQLLATYQVWARTWVHH